MEDSITPNIGFTSASGLVAPSVGFTSASALAVKPVSVTRHDSSSPPDLNTFEDCAQTKAEFDSFKPMPDSYITLVLLGFWIWWEPINRCIPAVEGMCGDEPRKRSGCGCEWIVMIVVIYSEMLSW